MYVSDPRTQSKQPTTHVSLQEAARSLKTPVAQLIAWNMVVVVKRQGRSCVPTWSVDPRLARVMPILSEAFEGEALELCLETMRPYGDARTGVDALRAGDWATVLPMLRGFRRKFDQYRRAERVRDWLDGVGDARTRPHVTHLI